jgi:lysozyme family protein
MNRNFQRALALVLKSEGGFVNDPRDPGGATNKGVTIATYRQYVKSNGTVADLKALTTAQAGIVYKKQYWDAVRGDDLPDGVDYSVFDFAVNSGPSRSAKMLQGVLGVVQDGQIGPATLSAVKGKAQSSIINTLCDNRLSFLKRLPTWGTFGKGWSSRVASVRAESLKMTGQAPQKPVQAPAAKPAATQPAKPQSLWAILLALFSRIFPRKG